MSSWLSWTWFQNCGEKEGRQSQSQKEPSMVQALSITHTTHHSAVYPFSYISQYTALQFFFLIGIAKDFRFLQRSQWIERVADDRNPFSAVCRDDPRHLLSLEMVWLTTHTPILSLCVCCQVSLPWGIDTGEEMSVLSYGIRRCPEYTQPMAWERAIFKFENGPIKRVPAAMKSMCVKGRGLSCHVVVSSLNPKSDRREKVFVPPTRP